jgi:hypothetical protein
VFEAFYRMLRCGVGVRRTVRNPAPENNTIERETLSLICRSEREQEFDIIVEANAIGPQPAARPPPCIDFGQRAGRRSDIRKNGVAYPSLRVLRWHVGSVSIENKRNLGVGLRISSEVNKFVFHGWSRSQIQGFRAGRLDSVEWLISTLALLGDDH